MTINVEEALKDEAVIAAIKKQIEEETTGLKSKNSELLNTNTDLKKLTVLIEQLGGIDKFQTLISSADDASLAQKAADMLKLEADGDITKIKDAHALQLSNITEQMNAVKQSTVSKEITNQLRAAIIGGDGITELLEPVLTSRIRGKYNENGSVSLEVLNAAGVPMLKDDGTEASLADLVTEMKNNDVFASAFRGTGANGMNSRETIGGETDTVNYFDKEGGNFNLTKAMLQYRDNPTKAKRMAEAAGFKIPGVV